MSSFLERAVKRGIRGAVNNAVGNAVEKAVINTVAPAANAAADQAAAKFNQAMGVSPGQQPQGYAQGQGNAQPSPQTQAAAANLGGMFASFQGAAMSFANEAAKNMKQCPSCGEAVPAANKFCPGCGGKLPEETIAQGSVCTSCGAQNTIGTKFCASCGAKLPAAIAEENAVRAKDEAVLAQWDSLLPHYPKWRFGGSGLELEDMGPGDSGYPTYSFSVRDTNYAALQSYRQLLIQNGFRPAGQYPSEDMLYKMVGGACYCFESADPFVSNPGLMGVGFLVHEPAGGFYYVKPEPKKPTSFRDILKNL